MNQNNQNLTKSTLPYIQSLLNVTMVTVHLSVFGKRFYQNVGKEWIVLVLQCRGFKTICTYDQYGIISKINLSQKCINRD